MPKIGLRLPGFMARQVGREPAMYEITRRIKRAAESILENEGLTADLDDEAAQVFLTGGRSCREGGRAHRRLKQY